MPWAEPMKLIGCVFFVDYGDAEELSISQNRTKGPAVYLAQPKNSGFAGLATQNVATLTRAWRLHALVSVATFLVNPRFGERGYGLGWLHALVSVATVLEAPRFGKRGYVFGNMGSTDLTSTGSSFLNLFGCLVACIYLLLWLRHHMLLLLIRFLDDDSKSRRVR